MGEARHRLIEIDPAKPLEAKKPQEGPGRVIKCWVVLQVSHSAGRRLPIVFERVSEPVNVWSARAGP